MENQAFTCRLEGCDGPRSGVCINSLTFEDCPDVIPIEQEADPEEALELPREEIEEVPTGGASSFSESQADAFLRQSGATLIAVIAPPEVGKTTLLATLYDRLQRGELNGLGFAGSETLRGYEQRCHLSRIASNAPVADTQRTPRDVTFLHLRIAHGRGIDDLVFADRSGEMFDEALGAVDNFLGFTELERCGALLFLVDLEIQFANPHEQRSKLQRTILALHQHGLLDGKRIALVGTKADRIAPEKQEEARSKLEDVAAKLTERAPSVSGIAVYMTAARKRGGQVVVAEELEELVASLFEEQSETSYSLPAGSPPLPTPLDRLMGLVSELPA